MLKWLITLLVAVAIITAVSPWLSRHGLGRLPGDVVVKRKGRVYYLPFTSTLVLSLALTLLARLV
jgi:hypothetical protein